MLKPRSRTVTFRMSSDEFAALTASCESSGARSISEYARSAVMERIQSAGEADGTLSGDLKTISKALRELDNSLRDVSKRIRGVLGSVRGEQENSQMDLRQ